MEIYIRKFDRFNLTYEVYENGKKRNIVPKYYWSLNQCLQGIRNFILQDIVPNKIELNEIDKLLDRIDNITINKEKVLETLHTKKDEVKENDNK